MKNFKKIFTGTGSKKEAPQSHSCCSGHEHTQQHGNNSLKTEKYQCPMKCEGDKTYDSKGNCPVCNMHLVLLDA